MSSVGGGSQRMLHEEFAIYKDKLGDRVVEDLIVGEVEKVSESICCIIF